MSGTPSLINHLLHATEIVDKCHRAENFYHIGVVLAPMLGKLVRSWLKSRRRSADEDLMEEIIVSGVPAGAVCSLVT